MAIFETKKSYSIILDQDTKDNTTSFAVNIVLRYLVNENLKAGITFGRSIFNDSMVISDTEFPNANKIVLSRVDRKHQDFELIDISKNKWDILFEILNINPKENEATKEFSNFIKQNLKRERNIDILFYYISIVYQTSYNSKEKTFDKNKAMLSFKVFSNIYRNGSTKTERIIATINFIKNPQESLLFEMLKAYNNDYKAIASNIQSLAEDRLPSNLSNMFSEVINSTVFTKNILQIMSYIVLSESYDEFVLNCLRMIK